MMSVVGKSLYWVGIAGLVGMLAVNGCARKSGVATTEGMESTPGPRGSEPLTGFHKTPTEEAVKPPAPVEVAKAEPKESRPGTEQELLNVYFAFDRWSLTTEGRKNLAQNAETLKQNASAKLLIEGHCDERGSREYNLVLGEKRAQETRRYLQALGITNPVSVISFGKERLVCTERDESCYWKNRRAHLTVPKGH